MGSAIVDGDCIVATITDVDISDDSAVGHHQTASNVNVNKMITSYVLHGRVTSLGNIGKYDQMASSFHKMFSRDVMIGSNLTN